MFDLLYSKNAFNDKVNLNIVFKPVCEYATKSGFQIAISVTDTNPHVSPGTSMV